MTNPVKNVIIHGDSREYIPRIKTPINCVVTDPPYGMDFTSNQAKTAAGKNFTKKIQGDDDPEEAVRTFHSIMGAIIPKLAPEADLYIFTAWHVLDYWIPAVKALSKIDKQIELKMMLVWEKGDPGMGDIEANWGCGHELILYLKKGRRPVPYRRSGVIHIDRIPAGKNIHPSEKPVPLLEILIEMSTDPGDLVVDPYSGSGSTSVAALRKGRNSLAFELDPQYIGPSRERLKQSGLFVV